MTTRIVSDDSPDQIAAALARSPLSGHGDSSPAAPAVETPPGENVVPASAPDTPPEVDEDALPAEPGQRETRGERRYRNLGTQIEGRLRQLTRLDMDIERKTAHLESLNRLTPAGPPASPAPVQVQQPTSQPQPEQYPTHEAYIAAMIQWGTRQEVERQREADRAAEQQRQQDEQQQRQQRQWVQRVQDGRDKYENWDDAWNVLGSRLYGPLEGAVITAVLESDVGGDLVHFLGTHPDELEKLRDLSPAAMTRRLGQMEAALSAPPPASPDPAPPRLTLPPPVTPVSGTTGPQTGSTAREGEALADYMKRRGPMTRRRY